MRGHGKQRKAGDTRLGEDRTLRSEDERKGEDSGGERAEAKSQNSRIYVLRPLGEIHGGNDM